MSGNVYLHVCTLRVPVCVYVVAYGHIHVCAHGNYTCAGIYLHRGTQNLQVSVYAEFTFIFTYIYMYMTSSHVCVYGYIFAHQVCMCVCVSAYVQAEFTCV
jgi:hypothetical protein